MEFIFNNIATIIVSIIVIMCIVFALRSIIKDKKSGKSCGCGSSCSGCAGSSMCNGESSK